jgi:hypothetical protein
MAIFNSYVSLPEGIDLNGCSRLKLQRTTELSLGAPAPSVCLLSPPWESGDLTMECWSNAKVTIANKGL